MNLKQLQNDPAKFREVLLIDTDEGPRPFGECMDDWQKRDFEKLDSGWKRAAGQQVKGDVFLRAWLERPRGHSKTLDLAVMCTWILFASRRRLSGIAGAGDRDQSRLLRDSISKLIYHNEWLSRIIEVQAYRVVNTKTESSLEIISSDAPSSYGLTPDFIVADEIVHWSNRDLWDSLLSSAAKRKTCMLIVITNAGFAVDDNWQWVTRENIRNSNAWYFSRLDSPCASWIDEDRLQEQKDLLPEIAYRRLWLNEWSQGSGGDALSPEIISAAFDNDIKPMSGLEHGYEFVAGMDLGVSRDASAVCVLGVNRNPGAEHAQIRLADARLWRPTKSKKVDLQEVEDCIFEIHDKFDLAQLNYDIWQAVHLASRLQAGRLGKMVRGRNRRSSLPMVEVPPTGQNLQRMASALLEAFNDRRVKLFEDPDLERDLRRLRVEERSYGFRLVSPRDSTGHGDLCSAFQLALLAATELASRPVVSVGVYIGQEDSLQSYWESRKEEYAAEQQYLEDIADDSDELPGWSNAMRRLGRL